MVSFGWVRAPEPALWLEGYTLPENPTFGPKLRGFEPVYPWDRPRPIPSKPMISIKRMQLTEPPVLPPAVCTQAAGPATDPGCSLLDPPPIQLGERIVSRSHRRACGSENRAFEQAMGPRRHAQILRAVA